jgi:hypothetical protein
MGRFLSYVLVFVLGGVVGFAVGGLGGSAAGAYLGACKVIDNAVSQGTMTQVEANGVMKSIAGELEITGSDKQRILDAIKKANGGASPCHSAIEAI